MEKSNFMFFRNTPTATTRSILAKSGFRETSYLDTYLGVPLSGKSPKIKDFCYLIDKVQTKLSHWKRVTLAKSVIEAIPTYTMMFVSIPQDCVNKIRQCQRSFIWSDSNDKKHLHTICWSIISRDKHNDGLGLRKLSIMNRSCLAKLC